MSAIDELTAMATEGGAIVIPQNSWAHGRVRIVRKGHAAQVMTGPESVRWVIAEADRHAEST